MMKSQACVSQQVVGGFIPRPNIKKLVPAKVSSSGHSLVQGQLKESKKMGCWPDFLGARAQNPHRAKTAKNTSKKWPFLSL